MTIEMIMTKLSDSFSIENDHVSDVRRYLSSCPDPEALYNEVKLNYNYSRPIRLSDFHKIASKTNLESGIREKYLFFQQCKKCGLYFSKWARGCVKCKKMTQIRIVRAKSYPGTFVNVHADCYRCNKYSDKVIGTSCEFWGKDVQLSGENLQICKDCQCRDCCREERNFRRKYDRGNLSV